MSFLTSIPLKDGNYYIASLRGKILGKTVYHQVEIWMR